MDIVFWAIPFFVASMLLEWRLTVGRSLMGYQLRDSAASLGMGVGNLAIMFSVRALTTVPFFVLYEYRLLDLSISNFTSAGKVRSQTTHERLHGHIPVSGTSGRIWARIWNSWVYLRDRRQT